MSPRILVVDSDHEIAPLVRTYLEESDFEVLVACDGETALHILRHERPDLLLLDLKLPQCDAGAVSRPVQGDLDLAAMPVVMLSPRPDSRIAGPEPATGDSTAQSFSPREVVAQVRAVLRRAQGASAGPKVVHVQQLTVDLEAHRVNVGGRTVHLTPAEFALLRCLAAQQGRALSRKELIEQGLSDSDGVLERTVDSHIKNLRHKLGEAGEAAHVVETVFGVGYRLAAGDSG
jgi:DNA-binding response OmpR family regulator